MAGRMTKEQAERKARECERVNGRPFAVVPVTYMNGEDGFDVTPDSKLCECGRPMRDGVCADENCRYNVAR